MREIEEQISQWRQSLAAEGMREEVIEELVSHLRDEVQHLLAAGRPNGTVVEEAALRLGRPEALAVEFSRAQATTWLPARLLAFAAAPVGIALTVWVVNRALARNAGPLLTTHVIALTLGYLATYATGLLTVCYLLARPFRDLTPGQRESARRTEVGLSAAGALLAVAGVILGAFWAHDNLGRYWGWDPRETGALLVVAWNILTALAGWRRWIGSRTVVLMGGVGSAAVTWAWFGAALLPAGGLGYSVVLACVVGQVALIGLAFVPANCLRQRA